MPNRSHFWGNSAYFFKILNGIFLLEIEAGILEFILVIGVLIMFFLGVGKNSAIHRRVRFPTPAQLKLSGRQFEVGDKANFVRNSRNG
ncbi:MULTISPECIES: hypothetical protein [Streptococcus]|uniref:hypothetical protein n=1 Tax=Streptococcus TaxID=1301 RepID=UPI002412E26C|nr:hypothetical protein [Streptococcus suis]MDG4500710.1 hypothetical protein [Streptococcus suis]